MKDWSIGLQKGYVIFGVEWDKDVDDLEVNIHFWPVTIVYLKSRLL